MHPTLTFDVLQRDLRERRETVALVRRRTERGTRSRPSAETRGRPPERARPHRLRAFHGLGTAVATLR
ncbi:hypothetical protein [Cellulomonas endometrii]|uniref:hypothetical protein n=1 Tax=Cellulomonas endometrii TaxID=3036301 RepID=UPI0024AD5FA1|nr:hypothetical protein [Cellulomonas endometrii]